MILSFTGSREGLSEPQHAALIRVLDNQENVTAFHHGACLGADALATICVKRMHPLAVIHAHPCNLNWMQSSESIRLSQIVHPEKPPLHRNRDLVSTGDLLIACPKGKNKIRSRSWSTFRFARSINKRIVLIVEDGTVSIEEVEE